MPEGDTLHRTARTLHKALAGKVLVQGTARNVDLSGRTVSTVEAQGKNLLVRFADGSSLLTHMRMTGSWHIYRPGERWRMPRHRARAVLETADFVAACFDAPTVELLRPGEDRLQDLGPDILAENFDAAAAATRLIERCGDQEMGNAVMDQRAVSGIGNIYKSESLFLAKVSPFARVSDLPHGTVEAVLTAAAKLMRISVADRPRDRSVYRRSGDNCPRCGATIAMKRQGELARSTYYCPSCQIGSES